MMYTAGLLTALLLAGSPQDTNIIEHLGNPLPLSTAWTDDQGNALHLGDMVDGKRPTVLVLGYFACPMLCGLVLEGLVRGLNDLSWDAGNQYKLLSASFDPHDTPDAARAKHLQVLGQMHKPPQMAAWPFLTGPQSSIEPLLDALGVTLWRDPQSGDYAHPAAIFILTPTGTVSHYMYGIQFTARDLKLALLDASNGKTGTTLERIWMRCHAYDPATRRFAPLLAGVMRTGGAVLLLLVGGTLLLLRRRETRRVP